MAMVDQHYAFVTFGDSRQKTSDVTFRVTAADANAYYDALTQVAKDATQLGLFFLSLEDVSAGTMMGKGVKLVTIEDTAAFPDPNDNVYNFDKLYIAYAAGLNNYGLSIPARDDTVYIVASDGVTVDLTTPTEVADLVSRFASVVISKYGVAGTVTEITVSS